MCSVTGLSLIPEKLYPAIREVLIHIVPSTRNGKMGCGGWHGSACHLSLLALWVHSCLQPGAQTQSLQWLPCMNKSSNSFENCLCKKGIGLGGTTLLQSEKDFLDSSLWKKNCKQIIVFSSHAAKSCLKQFCPWGRTYKRYTPVATSCNLLRKNHSSSAGSLLQSDSQTMFILHYDVGLVHSLPNSYVTD